MHPKGADRTANRNPKSDCSFRNVALGRITLTFACMICISVQKLRAIVACPVVEHALLNTFKFKTLFYEKFDVHQAEKNTVACMADNQKQR